MESKGGLIMEKEILGNDISKFYKYKINLSRKDVKYLQEILLNRWDIDVEKGIQEIHIYREDQWVVLEINGFEGVKYNGRRN